MNDIFYFVSFSGILLSIFLAFVLLRTKSKNNKSVKYLVLIFIFFALLIFYHEILPRIISSNFFNLPWLLLSFILFIGPLVLFYTKAITSTGFKLNIKKTMHFLPFVFYVLIIIILYKLNVLNKNIDFLIQYMWIIVFIHLGLYLFLIRKIILKHKKMIQLEYSNTKKINLSCIKKGVEE